jgi:hypothetical protein
MAWGRQPPVVRRERDGVLPGLIVLQPGSGQESRSRRPEAVNCRDGSGIPRWRKDGREVTHRRKGLDASASNAKSQDAARRQAAQDKPRPRPRHLAIGTLKHLLAAGLHALARTARRGASALGVLGARMTAAAVLVGCGIHSDNSRPVARASLRRAQPGTLGQTATLITAAARPRRGRGKPRIQSKPAL